MTRFAFYYYTAVTANIEYFCVFIKTRKTRKGSKHGACVNLRFKSFSVIQVYYCQSPHVYYENLIKTRMWANAQPDGRPAEHRWRPLFNAAKFV